MSKPDRDPSAVVVPFGKHKGTTVAELLTKDPQYAEWVLAQGWVADRFAELHAAILTKGAATDDTPEHNAIQARFLDEQFRVATLLARGFGPISKRSKDLRSSFLDHAEWRLDESRKKLRLARENASKYLGRTQSYEKSWHDQALAEIEKLAPDVEAIEAEVVFLRTTALKPKTTVMFEQRGVDVVIAWDLVFPNNDKHQNRRLEFEMAIEIKPSMGDDFPSVMRQMQRLGARFLVVEQYSGRSVPVPALRQMFEANGMKLIFLRDIEAEMANARDIIANGLPAQ